MSLHQFAAGYLIRRAPFLTLALLLIPASAFGQAAPSDSQTLQALLQEVRQLRRDLQITTIAAERVQILLYRLQAQEKVVGRAQQEFDDARSRLAGTQTEEKNLAARVKQMEDVQSNSQNPADRKEMEDVLHQLKARLEMLVGEDQQWQTRKIDAEQELQMEQAKLSGLQDELDRLEKTLEDLSRQSVAGPH